MQGKDKGQATTQENTPRDKQVRLDYWVESEMYDRILRYLRKNNLPLKNAPTIYRLALSSFLDANGF